MHQMGSVERTFASFSTISQGLPSNKIAASKNPAASINSSATDFLLIDQALLINKIG
jgi:hypothetical protein